jgi:hypothetical protein
VQNAIASEPSLSSLTTFFEFYSFAVHLPFNSLLAAKGGLIAESCVFGGGGQFSKKKMPNHTPEHYPPNLKDSAQVRDLTRFLEI